MAIPQNYTLETAAALEPVTLAEAQQQIRFFGSDENDLITELITAAREEYEGLTGRQLIDATWELRMDCFPSNDGTIELLHAPVQTIASVKYFDTDGAEQTWDAANYLLDPFSLPGRLDPAFGVSWPATRERTNAVKVTFTSGYGAAASTVPKREKRWILMEIARLWSSRGDPIPTNVKDDPAMMRLIRPRILKLFG